MKTIEEEIDEYFVRPLTKIFDGEKLLKVGIFVQRQNNTIALSMTRCG